jgi:hypothetical protein
LAALVLHVGTSLTNFPWSVCCSSTVYGEFKNRAERSFASTAQKS